MADTLIQVIFLDHPVEKSVSVPAKSLLFLDIDGVLNCPQFYMSVSREALTDRPYSDICSTRLQWLNQLCQEVQAAVVISSNWRIGKTLVEMQQLFQRAGALFPVIGLTPLCYFTGAVRGHEIKAWLEKNCQHYFGVPDHAFERYAILDDTGDMLQQQQSHFFQTDPCEGLTRTVCDRIKSFLTGPAHSRPSELN